MLELPWSDMGSGSVDVLLKLNSSCVDCWDQGGPPPNSILDIPPPPLPLFLQRAFNNDNNADPCSIQCDWNIGLGVEYVELPRQVVTGPAIDDTWLLVLGASFIGVILLGVLLTLLLLKAKSDRGGKGGLQLDVSPLGKTKGGIKGCEAVLYPCTSSTGGSVTPDSRILWAALTPRGTTQHFITEQQTNHHKISHYEVPHLAKPMSLPPLPVQPTTGQLIDIPAFDNTGFVDSDDPTYSEPLTPLYCEPILFGDMLPSPAGGGSIGSNTTLKRCATLRPTVSSPTRIEHPNLPPLNMMTHNHRSLRRATLSRKESDVNSSPVIL